MSPETSELILYAMPIGRLADVCAEYFARASEIGPSSAQQFPPHCTLTGFFQRSSQRVRTITAGAGRVLRAAGPVPPGAVMLTGLQCDADWVGLKIESDWLLSVTQEIVGQLRTMPGEDALRPKTWLHLSLAYGTELLDPYVALAEQMMTPLPTADWEIVLMERTSSGRWRRHSHKVTAFS